MPVVFLVSHDSHAVTGKHTAKDNRGVVVGIGKHERQGIANIGYELESVHGCAVTYYAIDGAVGNSLYYGYCILADIVRLLTGLAATSRYDERGYDKQKYILKLFHISW